MIIICGEVREGLVGAQIRTQSYKGHQSVQSSIKLMSLRNVVF